MNEVQLLRYQLIDAIMHISDLSQLRSLYEKTQPLSQSFSDSDIPTMEVKSNVSLEEIKAGQTIKEIDYEDYRERIEAENWEQSLPELLESL